MHRLEQFKKDHPVSNIPRKVICGPHVQEYLVAEFKKLGADAVQVGTFDCMSGLEIENDDQLPPWCYQIISVTGKLLHTHIIRQEHRHAQ